MRYLIIVALLACLACDNGTPTEPTNAVDGDGLVDGSDGDGSANETGVILDAIMTVEDVTPKDADYSERGYRSAGRIDTPCFYLAGSEGWRKSGTGYVHTGRNRLLRCGTVHRGRVFVV